LPKERYGNSLSGCGSNTQPSNWEADGAMLKNRYATESVATVTWVVVAAIVATSTPVALR